MSNLNLKVNTPFIVEQKIHENDGLTHTERYAYVVLEESKDDDSTKYGYRLANLTLGFLRPPVFRAMQDVERYIDARVTWKVIQEDVDYGFDTECIENENER